MADQGDRKTVRAFQCRDYLFEIFDRLSAEHQCSVDYLINEAMREYARAREQTVTSVGMQSQDLVGSAVVGATPMSAPPMEARSAPMLTPVPSRRPTVQPAVSPMQAVTVPPPLPGRRPSDIAARQVLTLQFNGQSFPVEKDEFIIGRGARSADLAIRDGNISTLITCIILFWFGSRIIAAPLVMGFALTLGIGVVMSMLTAIVVTRTSLRTIVFTALAKRVSLFRS